VSPSVVYIPNFEEWRNFLHYDPFALETLKGTSSFSQKQMYDLRRVTCHI